MKRCLCNLCWNPAAYISKNSNLRLCEDCFCSMEDDYNASLEDETGVSFNEYYDFIETDDLD